MHRLNFYCWQWLVPFLSILFYYFDEISAILWWFFYFWEPFLFPFIQKTLRFKSFNDNKKYRYIVNKYLQWTTMNDTFRKKCKDFFLLLFFFILRTRFRLCLQIIDLELLEESFYIVLVLYGIYWKFFRLWFLDIYYGCNFSINGNVLFM